MSRGEVERVRLGDVCRIVGGGTPSKKKSEYYTGNIPWASVRDMNCRILNKTEFSITKQAVEESATNVIEKGEVIISTHVGLGKVCVLGQDTAINQDLKAIIPIDELNRWYLYYWFEANARIFIANGKGATVKGVTVEFVKNLQIPLPPLSEQKRIAGELDRICELKRNAEARLQKLDLLVKAKFSEMFGDIVANDKGWEIVGFDNVAIIEGGLTNDFKKYSQFPHIGIDSIEKDTGILRGYRTVEEDNVVSGKYFFTPQHIIYSKIRPNLNKVALPTFEGLCSADAYAILPKDNIDRIYLAYILRSQYFLNYIVPLSGRTGMPKANQKQVRGFKLPLPPLPLQREFADFVEKVEGLKGVAKEELEKVDLLYRARLQEYFG